MEPPVALHRDLDPDFDPVAQSPLLRGMVLAMSYADAEGGIGLTRGGALNRRFVHWAAARFDWPGYTAADLFAMNKVLNAPDMPPLGPVHDLLLHLKLVRRFKGTLRTTPRGRDLAARPGVLFDTVAPLYLYRYVHDPYVEARGGLPGAWRIFLNVLNVETRTGCTMARLMEVLYGRPEAERYDPDYQDTRLALGACVLRPLCWLGLLWEVRDGPGLFAERSYHRTPLWGAALRLETDARADIRLV